jgi:hypothetical protein
VRERNPVDEDENVIEMPGPLIPGMGGNWRWTSAKERDAFLAEYLFRREMGEPIEGIHLPITRADGVG